MNFAEELIFAPGTSGSSGEFRSAGSSTSRQTPPPIAQRLRAARIASRMTQQELAEGLYSTSYLSAIERGKITPSLQALGKLAERLGLPISFFLGENEVDPEALEESSAMTGSDFDPAEDASEVDALLRLGKAEAFIRQDQASQALEALGGIEQPLDGLSLMKRPIWYWLAGWASGLLGDHANAIRLLERGMNLAESMRLRAPDAQKPSLAELVERLRCYLGVAYCANDQTDLALHHHLLGLKAIDKNIITDAELKVIIYKGLGREHLVQGHYREAITYYQLALKQAKDQADSRQQGAAAWGLGLCYQQTGDLAHARESYQEALEALELYGNKHMLAQIRSLLGQVYINQGDHATGEHYLRQSLEDARQAGDPQNTGIALGNLAALHLARGELEQALQTAQEGLSLSEQARDQRNVGHLHLTLSAIYTAIHDSQATEHALKEAIRIAEEISDRDLLIQAHQHYGDFLAAEGRFQEAYAEIQWVPPPPTSGQKSREHCGTQDGSTTASTA
jgi:tetratricopeptide (TPR) repeat protein